MPIIRFCFIVNFKSNWNRQRSFQEDPSYFSEPEFDTNEPGQQFHRSRRDRASLGGHQQPVSGAQSQYYGTIILPHQYRPLTGQATGTISRQVDRSKPFPGRELFDTLVLSCFWYFLVFGIFLFLVFSCF